jgi:hypothetical protein
MNSRSVSLTCATVILVGTVSACGPSNSSSSVSQSASEYSPPSVAATDCSQSNVPVAVPSTIPTGTISAETDNTRTSLLIKNTGDQTLLVIPQQETSLQQTPSVNPTDAVDLAALKAVTQVPFLGADNNIPAGTQLSTIFIVPPQYGVCGTVAEIGEYADVSVERDKEASAMWFVAHAVAKSLYEKITTGGDEDVQALTTCASDTASLTSKYPDLSDVDLYATVMQAGASCYKSYEAVFEEKEEIVKAEEDATKTREDVLDLLDRAPDLLESIHFAINLIHK